MACREFFNMSHTFHGGGCTSTQVRQRDGFILCNRDNHVANTVNSFDRTYILASKKAKKKVICTVDNNDTRKKINQRERKLGRKASTNLGQSSRPTHARTSLGHLSKSRPSKYSTPLEVAQTLPHLHWTFSHTYTSLGHLDYPTPLSFIWSHLDTSPILPTHICTSLGHVELNIVRTLHTPPLAIKPAHTSLLVLRILAHLYRLPDHMYTSLGHLAPT
jgi:hypothetical protein